MDTKNTSSNTNCIRHVHRTTIWSGSKQRYVNLGNEVYRIVDNACGDEEYHTGVLVQAIAGVLDSPIPGYHTNPDRITVCRIWAAEAEFVGVLRSSLKQVDPQQGETDPRQAETYDEECEIYEQDRHYNGAGDWDDDLMSREMGFFSIEEDRPQD